MKLWVSLAGSLIVAVMVVAGVSALGDGPSAPSVHGPTPNFTPPPPPPPPPGATLAPEVISSPAAAQPTFVVNGVPIYLVEGASFTDYGMVTDFGGGTPPPIVELYIGDSSVRFDRVQGTLLEQSAHPADASAFQPLMDALKKPVVNSIEEALKVFAPYLSTLAAPDSVAYVETTVSEANALFEPNRKWGASADVPAWAIVAHGQSIPLDPRDQREPPIPTIWVIVSSEPAGIFVGTDDRVPFGGIDLSKLGKAESISPSLVQKA